MAALIKIANLSYRPDSLPPEKPDILRNITFEIEEGAFVAIIGKNGSGKTTLIKHLNGLLLPTEGRIQVGGLDTRQPEHRRQLRLMVGMVFQDPSDQIVASTVEEDIAFGLENFNLPTHEIRDRVSMQLTAAGLLEDATRPPHLLSGGQIQKLALAGVLARHPRVILLDEPTSMLDPSARESFLDRIRLLHQQGITIIYVTHHMEEAVFADQVVVMNAGSIALLGSPMEIFLQNTNLHEIGLDIPEVVRMAGQFRRLGWDIDDKVLTSDELLEALPICNTSASSDPVSDEHAHRLSEERIISFQDVHYTYLANTHLAKPALKGVNLDINLQQVHGIAGANGSGKSTLLQHINGILRPSQGSIHVASFKLEEKETILREVIKKVGLVFQNPETQFFEVYVGDEIAYGPKQFELADLRERVSQAMALVGLDFEDYKDRRLETLSGGEKRKVALASTLILDQDILLFDEPTAGMDPRARDDLLSLFCKLSTQGKTIIIASHRLEELALVSQKLSIMQNGQVTHTASSHEVLFDRQTIIMAGLVPPLAVKISKRLIALGWPIEGKDTSTPNRLLQVLQELTQ